MGKHETTPADWFHRMATHYVEAQILFHLNQAGVLSLLKQEQACTSRNISDLLNLDEKVTDTLLDYIYNIDELLDRDNDGNYSFSAFGREVVERFSDSQVTSQQNINMFDVRVGCFGPVWQHLGQMLTGKVRYGDDFRREGSFADKGLSKLSKHFWPSLAAIINELHVEQALEIGLTTGLLERIGVEYPEISLYGLDKNAQTIEASAKRARDKHLDNIHWIVDDVFNLNGWNRRIDTDKPGLIYSIHFHEIIAAGKHKLIELLARLNEQFPNWYVLAYEQPFLERNEREKIPDTLWLYSQSNILIHHLIGNGRILSKEAWAQLGHEAGCSLISDELCEYLGYRAFVFKLQGSGHQVSKPVIYAQEQESDQVLEA